MQSLFDRYFGHTKAARRASVCGVGIEANPNHAPPLEQLGRMLRRHGMRAHFLTETAAATAEGTVSFNLQVDQIRPSGPRSGAPPSSAPPF